MTRLNKAVAQNNFQEVKRLLDLETNPNSRDKEGLTPLAIALITLNLDMTKYLLSRGANIHTKSRYGEPPLLTGLFAIKDRKDTDKSFDGTPFVEALLLAGADVNAQSNDVVGRSIIEKSITFFPEYLSLLKKYVDVNQNNLRHDRDYFFDRFKAVVHDQLDSLQQKKQKLTNKETVNIESPMNTVEISTNSTNKMHM